MSVMDFRRLSAFDPESDYTRGATIQCFGSHRFGWLHEPGNDWCQNWIRLPDNADWRGYIEVEAGKFIPFTVMFVSCIAVLAAVIVLLAQMFNGVSSEQWKVTTTIMGAGIAMIPLTWVWFMVWGSDWVLSWRENRRRERNETNR